MPFERFGSTAKARRIRSQMPVDWTVYFWTELSRRSFKIGGGAYLGDTYCTASGTDCTHCCFLCRHVWTLLPILLLYDLVEQYLNPGSWLEISAAVTF